MLPNGWGAEGNTFIRWVQNGERYRLNTTYADITISEFSSIAPYQRPHYRPRIQTPTRRQVEGEICDDFEDAEAWIRNAFLSAETVDWSAVGDRTLELLARRLPADLHPGFLARLNYIGKLLGAGSILLLRRPVLPAPQPNQWSWHAQGNHYSMPTPYGVAIIVEEAHNEQPGYLIGRPRTYHARIEHSTGAVLSGREAATFENAEAWIRETLDALDGQLGDKEDIEQLIFTLDICIKVLPPDTDALHYYWLEQAKLLIDLILR